MNPPLTELTPAAAEDLVRASGLDLPAAPWRLEPVPTVRPDPCARQQFIVHHAGGPAAFLTVGRNLDPLLARTRALAAAYPDLIPAIRSQARLEGCDLLLGEYVAGQPFLPWADTEPDAALALLQSLAGRFDRAPEIATPTAAGAELATLVDRLKRLDCWTDGDLGLLDRVILPFLREHLIPAAPTVRWSHGDLIPRNLLVTPAGQLRLIDCEHALHTHFHGEDWFRFGYWDRLPPVLRHWVEERTTNRTAWTVYLACRQLLLEQPLHRPRRFLLDAEHWCGVIRAALAADPAAAPKCSGRRFGPSASASAGVQLFWEDERGWREAASLDAAVPFGSHDLTFTIPAGSGVRRLRLDPLDLPGTVRLTRCEVTDEATAVVLFSATGPTLGALEPAGDATAVGHPDAGGLQLVSRGADPQILLPPFPAVPVGPLQVRVTLTLAPPPAAALLGNVEQISPQAILGWAHDPGRPNEPVEVDIRLDGIRVGTVTAAAFRADLRAAGLGDGRKAFFFNPSPHLGTDPVQVQVTYRATGTVLPGGEGRLEPGAPQAPPDWDAEFRALRDELPAAARLARHPPESWPLLSVVVPVHNPPAGLLERAVASVQAQTYPRWELVLVDDASTDPAVRSALAAWSAADARIKVRLEATNAGISETTNRGVEAATGSFVALLDHDDELTPDALEEVVAYLLDHPATDVLYSDQDKLDATGARVQPFFKPDWSPLYLLGVMYVGHLLVVRRSLYRQVGGCDRRFDRVQDYELMLRLAEATTRIAHLPRILYHWRVTAGSIAGTADAKGPIDSLQAAAVQAHLERRRLPLRAVSHPRLPHRVQLFPAQSADSRPVSIIIPTRDAPEHIRRCLHSLFRLTPRRALEVIVADTGTTDPVALAALAAHPIRRLDCPGPFNFSRVNNQAAAAATGEVLLFLNNDTEVLAPGWLEVLLAHLDLPGVGAVAPVLLYPDGTVQHAGIALGLRGTCDHVLRHADPEGDGHAGNLPCAHEVAAVTAACLLIRRADFLALGGFEEGYAHIYQDADLCLRLRSRGLSCLSVGAVRLRHHESASRGRDYDFVDRAIFRDRWQDALAAGDPYYNPNLTRNRGDYHPR